MLRQMSVLLGLSASLLGVSPGLHAAEAGKVVFVTGQVQLASRAALLDAAVNEGDELSTGADGYVYVKTVDSGFLILRPNSKARITTYHIDQANPGNTHVKLELLGGVARSISGQGVKQARQNFRFNTPVAAIGVRGTDFIVYTDQQTSRVAVVSGGIVVSGFAGNCGPEGGGPCEGSASRELFAGQSGVLLQVQRGQHVPQLLRSPALAPDQSAPPRNDEPVGKVGGGVAATSPEVNLDAQKGASLLNSAKLTGQTKNEVDPAITGPVAPVVVAPVVDAPVVETPVVVAPEVPVVPSPPEVMWGRWRKVAELPVDAEQQAKFKDGSFDDSYFLGSYRISRLKNSALVLPKEGTAGFALTGSEASLQEIGQAAQIAAVKDASLTINFGTKRFETALTVYTPTASMLVSGRGDITSGPGAQSGNIVSDILGSPATIRGYLGGAQAAEAAYIFKSTASPKYVVEGATTWKRK